MPTIGNPRYEGKVERMGFGQGILPGKSPDGIRVLRHAVGGVRATAGRPLDAE